MSAADSVPPEMPGKVPPGSMAKCWRCGARTAPDFGRIAVRSVHSDSQSFRSFHEPGLVENSRRNRSRHDCDFDSFPGFKERWNTAFWNTAFYKAAS